MPKTRLKISIPLVAIAVSCLSFLAPCFGAGEARRVRPGDAQRSRIIRTLDPRPEDPSETATVSRRASSSPRRTELSTLRSNLLRRMRRTLNLGPGGQNEGARQVRQVRAKALSNRRRTDGPGRFSHTLRGLMISAEKGEPLPAHRLGDAALELLRGDELKIDFLLGAGDIARVRGEIEALGGEFVRGDERRLVAWVPYEKLGELKQLRGVQAARLGGRFPNGSGVRRMRSAAPTTLKTGQVESEAIGWSGADEWQAFDSAAHGIERDLPVRVAIIDMGFLGYEDLLGSDLPASVTTRDFASSWDIEGCLDGNPLDPCVATGTALAEIVSDMDPLVELTLIAVDPEDMGSMRDAVDYLLGGGAARADIVLNGLVWSPGFYGDGFGSGMFNGMISEAIAADIMWVNDTGDLDYLLFLLYANDIAGGLPAVVGHWTGSFVDDYDHFFHNTFELDGYMDRWFADQDPTTGDTWLSEFCLGAGDVLYLDLVWSNWIDANGNGIPETEDDYSLDVIARTDEGQIVIFDSSRFIASNYQGGEEGDYPWDSFLVANGSAETQCYELAIYNEFADGDDDFHLFWAGDSDALPGTVSAAFQGPAFVGHGDRMIPADTEGVFAVGTMKMTGEVEEFSLYGLEGEGRPGLCAPADVRTRSFGTGGFATSFSAAHVAGATSLLMSKLGFVTYAEAMELLEARARDIQEDTTGVMCGSGGLCLLTGQCP